MSSVHRHKGFSLTEVLLAVGTLAIGMTFIAGTFLVGVHLSTVATERTIAAVVADEAFAKIQLYGLQVPFTFPTPREQVLYTDLSSMPVEELAYPSTKIMADKQYYWSALCMPINAALIGRPKDINFELNVVQVTVFISRKIGSASVIPEPVEVPVTSVIGIGNENKLTIDNIDQQSFINAGSKIVDNSSGKIYRVVERDAVSQNTIILDVPWRKNGTSTEPITSSVWVVPPIGTGRNPCIAVYQREIRF